MNQQLWRSQLLSQQQILSSEQLFIAQIEQPQDQSQQDPLIDYGAEHLIDFGVVLIAVTLID